MHLASQPDELDNDIVYVFRFHYPNYFLIRITVKLLSLSQSKGLSLANSLVTSKLDLCNSVPYGLLKSSLHSASVLQRIRNSLASDFIPSARSSDHWLMVAQRISFKITVITLKVLHNTQPSYLSDIINWHRPARLFRSCDQNLLSIPVFPLHLHLELSLT